MKKQVRQFRHHLYSLLPATDQTFRQKPAPGGDFKFALKPDVDYIFLASKKGYLNGKEKETTKGQEKSREFMVTILLTAIDKPIELPNIFYDFGKWDLRPESMVSLDKLVETLQSTTRMLLLSLCRIPTHGILRSITWIFHRKEPSLWFSILLTKELNLNGLSAKGYGESSPKVVDAAIAAQSPFLKAGTTLTEQYINSLSNDEQKEIAHQINRRTEFRVLRTDYESPKK